MCHVLWQVVSGALMGIGAARTPPDTKMMRATSSLGTETAIFKGGSMLLLHPPLP